MATCRYHIAFDTTNQENYILFKSFDGRVAEGQWDSFPAFAKEAAEHSNMMSLDKLMVKEGWSIILNRWTSPQLTITKVGEEWLAKATCTHKFFNKTKTMEVDGTTSRGAANRWYEAWNNVIDDDYGHLGAHTHIRFRKPAQFVS